MGEALVARCEPCADKLMSCSPGDPQLVAMRKALPRLLGNLDDATFDAICPHLKYEWVELAGGQVLFAEGDPSDSIYLLLSGRMQASVLDPGGDSSIIGEIGRGESVGEMGVLTGQPRRATVRALRDSVLARIELASFAAILKAGPDLALNLNRIIIERLQRRNSSQKPTRNVKNLAVIGVSDGFPGTALLRPLLEELGKQGRKVIHLTSKLVDASAGRAGAAQATDGQPDAHHWLVNFLDDLESQYELVFYEADLTSTPWTRRCLRQADELLLFAAADSPPKPCAIENQCLDGPLAFTRVRQTLVLLHPANAAWASGAHHFTAARPAVERHYNVRLGNGQDLARLARCLSGKSVGLVLSGGGARGLAHIGVFRALKEAKVPIDSIGGTSIGSVLAACIACDWSYEKLYRENKREFLSNPTSDFNLLPLVSLLAGKKLDRILEASLGGREIEELWLPFFCVSSSYTKAREHVHTSGHLKRAVMASMAIPGVFPPVVHGNELLVDGGIFNNMPIDVMARTGADTILAVDLRPEDKDRGPLQFDKIPGTWALLLDRLRPKPQRLYPLPSIITTLIASSTLNCEQKMCEVVADVDLLFNPEVSKFGMLDWKSYDLIVEEGYRHAMKTLEKHWPLK